LNNERILPLFLGTSKLCFKNYSYLDDLPLNSDDLMEERPILELKPMFDFAAKIQVNFSGQWFRESVIKLN